MCAQAVALGLSTSLSRLPRARGVCSTHTGLRHPPSLQIADFALVVRWVAPCRRTMASASARRAAGRSVETVGEAELRRFLSAAGMHDSVVSTLASNDIRSLADAKLLSTDDLKELDLPVGTRNKLMQLLDTTDLRLTVTTRSARHRAEASTGYNVGLNIALGTKSTMARVPAQRGCAEFHRFVHTI